MEKRIILICLLFLAVCHLQAQRLVGQWRMEEKQGEENSYIIDVKDNAQLSFIVGGQFNQKNAMELNFRILLNGNYSQDKKKITIQLDKDNTELVIDHFIFLGQAAQLAKANPKTEETVREMIKAQLNGSKKKIVENIPIMGELNIEKMTKKELILKNPANQTIYHFKRIK